MKVIYTIPILRLFNLQFRFEFTSEIAVTGHTSWQNPQKMHFNWSSDHICEILNDLFKLKIEIDWVGQNLEQSWQEMQFVFLIPKNIKCFDLQFKEFNDKKVVDSIPHKWNLR